MRKGTCRDNAIVRGHARIAGSTVRHQQGRTVAHVGKHGSGAAGHGIVVLDRDHARVAQPVAEQRRGIAGASADLQDAVPVLDVEVLQHPCHQARHGG